MIVEWGLITLYGYGYALGFRTIIFGIVILFVVAIALFLEDDKSDSTNYDDCDTRNHADRHGVFRIDCNSRSLSSFRGCGFFRTNTVR